MSSYLGRIAFQLFAGTPCIIVKIVFDLVVNQIFSVFCAEYNMCVYTLESD